MEWRAFSGGYSLQAASSSAFNTGATQKKPRKTIQKTPKREKMEWQGFTSGGYSYQTAAPSIFNTGATQKKPQKIVQKTPNREKYMEKVEVWVCKICNKDYANRGSLSRHFATAHEQQRPKPVQPKSLVQKLQGQGFVCRHCGGEYSTQGNLNRHVTTVHEKPKANIAISKSTKVVQKKKTNVTVNVYNPVTYNRSLY